MAKSIEQIEAAKECLSKLNDIRDYLESFELTNYKMSSLSAKAIGKLEILQEALEDVKEALD